MSTTSGTTDISVKYQRLATEFVKLRGQVSVLKNAVVEEQERSAKLTAEVHEKDKAFRKCRDERESLQFRNEQLVKRVEALQNSLDESHKLQNSKGKKKQREANLRLFVDLSEQSPGIAGSSSSADRRQLFEQELERKVLEVSELYSKVYDLEKENEHIRQEFTEKIVALEAEQSCLRDQLNTKDKQLKAREVVYAAEKLPEVITQNNHEPTYSIPSNDEIPPPVQNDSLLEEAKLYADGIISTSKLIVDGFEKFFSLSEQRSSLYPFDSALEPVPINITNFCTNSVNSSKEFGILHAKIADLHQQLTDAEDIQFLKPVSESLWKEIHHIVTGVRKKYLESFRLVIREENQVPWCGSALEEATESFRRCLSNAFQLFNELSSENITTLMKVSNRQKLLDSLTAVRDTFKETRIMLEKKILRENHIPTSSKKLKCVNDCFLQSVIQIENGFSRIVSLSSDFRALNHLAAMVRNEPAIPAVIIPVVYEKNMNDSQLNECSSSNECSEFMELKHMNERLNEKTAKMDAQLLELSRSKTEWEGTVSALESELEVLRLWKDEQTQAADSVNPKAKAMADCLEEYLRTKIKDLSIELRFSKGEAKYYKDECNALLMSTKMLLQNQTGNESCSKCQTLSSALEDMRVTFEDQMRQLYDQLDEQEAILHEQKDQIRNMSGLDHKNPKMSRENSIKQVTLHLHPVISRGFVESWVNNHLLLPNSVIVSYTSTF